MATVIVCTLLSVFGCGSTVEPLAVPAEDGVPPPAMDPGPATQDAPAATSRLTLPVDFPTAVPLLPQRRILSFSPRGYGSFSLTCSTAQGPADAAAFYRENLAAAHWEMTLDSLSGGMTSIAARQEDGDRLTVNIIEGSVDQRTMIGIYYLPADNGDDG